MFDFSFVVQLATSTLFLLLLGCGKKASKDPTTKKRRSQKSKGKKDASSKKGRRQSTAKKGSTKQKVKSASRHSKKAKKTDAHRNQAPEPNEPPGRGSQVKLANVKEDPVPKQKTVKSPKVDATPDATKPEDDVIKPRVMPLSKKAQQIAKGEKRKRNAYPTMDDVKSDWGSEAKEVEAKKTKDQVEEEKICPKVVSLDAKAKLIAKGQKCERGDYPTMDDVKSDWKSKTEDAKSKQVKDDKASSKKLDKNEEKPNSKDIKKNEEKAPTKEDQGSTKDASAVNKDNGSVDKKPSEKANDHQKTGDTSQKGKDGASIAKEANDSKKDFAPKNDDKSKNDQLDEEKK